MQILNGESMTGEICRREGGNIGICIEISIILKAVLKH